MTSTKHQCNSKEFKIKSDVDQLGKTIIDVNKLASKYNLKIWLGYGALLGMVREKRLLPWNNDAELGFHFEENYHKKIIKIADELSLLGYNVYFYSTIGCLSVKKIGVVVNLNCFWKEKEFLVRPHEECVKWFSIKKWSFSHYIAHYSYWLARSMSIHTQKISIQKIKNSTRSEIVKNILITINRVIPKKIRTLLHNIFVSIAKKAGAKFTKTAIPSHYFDEFEKINLLGEEIIVPKKKEQLLEYIYGKNWKIPKENWSFYDNKNKKESNIKYINESWDYKNALII